jgi:hypothetical protein
MNDADEQFHAWFREAVESAAAPEVEAPAEHVCVIQLVPGGPAQAVSVSPAFYAVNVAGILAEGSILTLKHTEDDRKLYRVGPHQPLGADGWVQINLTHIADE